MKRIFIYILTAICLSAACSKPEIIQGSEDCTDTAIIQLKPHFTDELTTEITTKSPVPEDCNILCFAYVFNNNNFIPVDGYPKMQTERTGDMFSFIIPKLFNLHLVFAIIPEDVEYTFVPAYSSYMIFKPTDGNRFGKKAYMTGDIFVYPTSGNIPVINAELKQQHRDIKYMLSFVNFPNSDEREYIKHFVFDVNSDVYGEFVTHDKLEHYTDEQENTTYHTYDLTYLPENSQFNYYSYTTQIRMEMNDGRLFNWSGEISGSKLKLKLNIDYMKLFPY